MGNKCTSEIDFQAIENNMVNVIENETINYYQTVVEPKLKRLINESISNIGENVFKVKENHITLSTDKPIDLMKLQNIKVKNVLTGEACYLKTVNAQF